MNCHCNQNSSLFLFTCYEEYIFETSILPYSNYKYKPNFARHVNSYKVGGLTDLHFILPRNNPRLFVIQSKSLLQKPCGLKTNLTLSSRLTVHHISHEILALALNTRSIGSHGFSKSSDTIPLCFSFWGLMGDCTFTNTLVPCYVTCCSCFHHWTLVHKK